MVVDKLRAAGCDPKPQGPGLWESRCPVHNGTRRNLSVTLGSNGSVLLHCHHADGNGNPSCSPKDILGSLGLGMGDLYPDRAELYGNGSTAKPKTSGKKSWRTLEDALRAVASKIEPKPIKTESWGYHNAHGEVVMVVARFDAGDGSKNYRPFHPLPDGSWAMGDPPGLLPLYRLPEVIKSNRTVFVGRGIRCCRAADIEGAGPSP
jgi:putative DNA primase/helicase